MGEQKRKHHPVKQVGPDAWEWTDGSIRNSKGRWVKQHPGGKKHMITKENASAMARRRWEKLAEKAAEGVARGVEATTPYSAAKKIGYVIGRDAVKGKGHVAVANREMALKLLGHPAFLRDQGAAHEGQGLTVHLSEKAAIALAEVLGGAVQRQAPEVVEAEAREVAPTPS